MLAAMVLSALLPHATAQTAIKIEEIPCAVISGVWRAIVTVGSSLIVVMLMYGAGKYAFSADDPGGRKQGKTIMIHAIIGALMMSIVVAVVTITGVGALLTACGMDVTTPP